MTAAVEIAYTVRCAFGDPTVAAEWLDWMRAEHLAAVLAAGALSAELVCLDPGGSDTPSVVFEARYRFASRAAFDRYESHEAPRLRAAGLARFPAERGVAYARTVGAVVIAATRPPSPRG